MSLELDALLQGHVRVGSLNHLREIAIGFAVPHRTAIFPLSKSHIRNLQ